MSKRVVGFVKDVDETVHYIIGFELQDLTYDGLKQGEPWISWQIFTRCGRETNPESPTTRALPVTCIRCLDQTSD